MDECRLTLDKKAEVALRWKIDLRTLPIVSMLYLFCLIDRANIGNARLAGLEADLHMTNKYDFNMLLTSAYVAFVVFEIPASFLCKVIGPGIFIPCLSVSFGALCLAMAFVQSFSSAMALRFLLGLAEAGVYPSIVYYLSRWYRKDELCFRLALFIVFAPLSGAFGGLFASGLLEVKPFGAIHSWRMIFFVEGLITMGLGLLSFFLLPDRPETAKWLNTDEKALCAARSKSENVGAIEVVDSLKKEVFFAGMFNTTSVIITLTAFFVTIPILCLGFFLPTIVKTIFPNKGVIALQLRTVPPWILGAVMALILPYLSWKTKRRAVYIVIASPLTVIGYLMFTLSSSPHVRYAACFLITAGATPFLSLATTWTTINTTSDTARAGAIALFVFGANTGGLVATWSYLPQFAPRNLPGNILCLVSSLMVLILTLGLWKYHLLENARRDAAHDDALLEGMSDKDVARLGQKHPGFRFRL
ncbi:BZ3500_MvSof-1268-A1-R1_Chr3-1g06083 [Microbotryum saponariae]|uniref:BZ3500_MvSof-1268-A1-R1_Chr3-1g06083 protein n=1 Tax=Microbotryum saponariae TaxID=289078 RepID=A0A2X0LAK6_9BASI|nr:BZ3500_MvSof-1268-A1-R1_Chr3-1g06083 [Microbotryum saponariae]SDA03931.1 BZ3501_MvSof-1269-A2-R1_Chr3-2g05768 [Microbotryum saponariae]